jgi:stearoyl-CoA desaturase (delta-9 desaturase)
MAAAVDAVVSKPARFAKPSQDPGPRPAVKPAISSGFILASVPYAFMHLACLAVFWTGVSADALLVCFVSYAVRMFGVTAAYHRYFSHRSYKTSRVFQFLLALLATSSAQLGPLWWAATHRHHHATSDTQADPHSPRHYGFLWAHMGWFLHPGNRHDSHTVIRDYAKYPELVWIDRWCLITPALLGLATYGLGVALQSAGRPTSGAQMLVWGFVVATILLYHGTYTINSLSHVFGSQRFYTGDDSRNNPLLAMITLGEGWHNNHHRYQSSCRQGIYWWELDITYLVLQLLARLGLVWELRPVPQSVYAEAAHNYAEAQQAQAAAQRRPRGH